MRTDEQAEMMNLIVAYCNFANALKNADTQNKIRRLTKPYRWKDMGACCTWLASDFLSRQSRTADSQRVALTLSFLKLCARCHDTQQAYWPPATYRTHRVRKANTNGIRHNQYKDIVLLECTLSSKNG